MYGLTGRDQGEWWGKTGEEDGTCRECQDGSVGSVPD